MTTETQGLIPNDPITIELQERCLDAFKKADKAEGLRRGSRLVVAYCLAQAWLAPCEAIVKNQKGETVFSHSFTVGDYCDPAKVEAAAGDSAQSRGAMAAAVIERLSGVVDPSGAQKQALNAARPVALGLIARIMAEPVIDETTNEDGETVTTERERTLPEALAEIRISKGGNVQVPGYVMLKEPDREKAPESAVETYDKERDKPFTLDGSKGRSFNELSSRVRPKDSREGQSGQGGGEAKALSRIDAAKVLLGSAAGAGDWVEYLAALPSIELVAMVRAWGERDADETDQPEDIAA